MEHDKKLAFLQNLTHMALTHVASTPNIPTPKGDMSHEKMLSFVSGMAKNGLQHFDDGGTALAPPSATIGPSAATTPGGINGAIGNFLGTNNKFQASATPIQAGTNTAQLNQAYTGAQGALGQQAGIAGTLNGGLQQGAGSQQTLSNLYTNQALGNGPNPAQAQLNQSTGQNIAAQAALAANQRGAGANAGLLARQVGQQGAATQQQAVGQSAVMNAQQQLAAEQNLQNLSASQVGQGLGATQGLNNAQQNEQNILQGSNTAANNANVSQQSNINNVNAGISTANQNNAGNIVSGIGGLISGGLGAIGSLFAHGGAVEEAPWVSAPKRFAEGGIAGQATGGPQSFVGNWLNSTVDTQGPGMQPLSNFNTALDPLVKKKQDKESEAQPNPLQDFDPNATAPIGEAGASDLPAANTAGMTMAYDGGLMKNGGNVKANGPGEKAVKKGDSLSNDKIPAMLSEGEVVIDRDTLADKGPIGQMARALAAHIAKKNKGKKQ